MKFKRPQYMRLSAIALAVGLLSSCATNPEMLSSSELEQQAQHRLDNVTKDQVAVSGPVTLYEAMARAIKYNLDTRVEQMEVALRKKELSVSRYDMLPQMLTSAGWTNRNNYRGSFSRQFDLNSDDESFVAAPQLLPYNTSSEKSIFISDIRVGWDVLDFGLSYVRSKQAADHVMIAMENRRLVANRIIEDVRTAYWRAVSADRMLSAARVLEKDVEQALSESEQLLNRERVAPMTALSDQRDLLRTQKDLNELKQELVIAKHQLASLMNIDPSTHYELALPDEYELDVIDQVAADEMIDVALKNRPELREVSYQQRINATEAKAALLDLIPGLRLHADFNHEDNDFLFNQDWVGWGAKASWNLLEAFRYPARKRAIDARGDLLEQKSLAMTMAVMTQVHVSRTRFAHAKRNMMTLQRYRTVQHKILGQVQAGHDSGRLSRHTLIRERMNTLVSEVKHDIAVAGLHNAYANIYAAMGIDGYGPKINGSESLEEMAEELRLFWQGNGDNHISYGERSGVEGVIK